MRNSLVAILLVLALIRPVFSSDIKDEGKPADIQVEIGKVTQVEFPAKISKVVKGGNQDSVLVEVLDNSLYLLPKTQEPSDVFVTTVSGSSYPLTLHLGSNRDIKIQVGKFKAKGDVKSAGSYSDIMDLMKDLLLDQEPAGSTMLPAQGKVLLSNQQMSLTVEKAYEMVDWNAYVLVAHNLISNAVIVPIEQINLPNLLAITCDRDMISAKGQEGDSARVIIIVGNTNEYRAI